VPGHLGPAQALRLVARHLRQVGRVHQGLATRPGPTVLTWYLPLAGGRPEEGRQRLLSASREQWAWRCVPLMSPGEGCAHPSSFTSLHTAPHPLLLPAAWSAQY
jgi:hypothetical protein